jgi:hypothetical protein
LPAEKQERALALIEIEQRCAPKAFASPANHPKHGSGLTIVITGKGNHAWQEQRRRQIAEDRYGGICECGNHAWAQLTKGFVAFVSLDDACRIQRQSYTAQFCRGKVYHMS